MNFEKVKHYCKSIIHLVEKLEETDQKAEVNDILIGIDNYRDVLNDELMR